MNNQKRRKFTPEFKAKVALEALKEQSTLSVNRQQKVDR
jgi:transposase-like protein